MKPIRTNLLSPTEIHNMDKLCIPLHYYYKLYHIKCIEYGSIFVAAKKLASLKNNNRDVLWRFTRK